jgi:F-type H+-transporting ATPase subunit b
MSIEDHTAARPRRARRRHLPAVLLVVVTLWVGFAGPGWAATVDPAQAHGEGAETAGHESIWPVIARIVNFAILAGILVYFLKSPITRYLSERSDQIREELTGSVRMRDQAGEQLAAAELRLKELPAVVADLRERGIQEIAAEERRIDQIAEADRQRLVDQTRREIDVQLRIAKRDLVRHAAELAVEVASDRVRSRITDADRERLVDRYVEQVRSSHE